MNTYVIYLPSVGIRNAHTMQVAVDLLGRPIPCVNYRVKV